MTKFRDGKSSGVRRYVPIVFLAAVLLTAGYYISTEISVSQVENQPAADTASKLPSALPVLPEGDRFTVVSDPKAQYFLISHRKMQSGNIEALTKRIGPSGISHSRREIDCETSRSRYLGSGDKLEDASSDALSTADLSIHEPASISGEVASYVCALNGPNQVVENISPANGGALGAAQSAIRDYCRGISVRAGGSYTLEEACIVQEDEAMRRVANMSVPESVQRYCADLLLKTHFSWAMMEVCIDQEVSAMARIQGR